MGDPPIGEFSDVEGLEFDPGQPGEELLVIDDEDRYGRLRLISWWRQEKLRASRVLVVGAGALGNEVLKNLALLGVGTVRVIDRDVVEHSNLSRSVLFRAEDWGRPKAEVIAERASELNPDVHFLGMQGDVMTAVGLGYYAEADVVLGCLDNREARLWINRQCWKVGTPWVDAAIQEIQGVVKVFVPPDSACYECAMTRRDYELLNVRYSCPLLRREDLMEGKVPTVPTIASMMAGLQVQEALKILHGLPVEPGVAIVFNGESNQLYKTKLPRREECLSHETYPAVNRLELGGDATAADLFRAAGSLLTGPLTLALERDLLVWLECPRCGTSREVMRPRVAVSQGEARCPSCGNEARPEVISEVEEREALAERRLVDLGIPPYDIVRVDGPSESAFFLLENGTWGGEHSH